MHICAFPLKAAITEYLELQRSLICAFFETYPEGEQGDRLFITPRKGEIFCLDQIWSFRRHGSGIEFVSCQNRVVVDLDESVSSPNLFTVWRLSKYLTSVTDRNVEVSELQPELDRMLQEGTLRIVRNKYYSAKDEQALYAITNLL